MSEEDAAEYVSVSVSQFRAEVEKGVWPHPVERGCRRNTYDRDALNRAVDRLSPVDEPDEDDLLRGAREWGKSK